MKINVLALDMSQIRTTLKDKPSKPSTVGTVLSAAVVVNFENFSKGKLL